MARVTVINTGFFKLDGGAMFGVVPKSMWSKLNPPDDHNMCTWAMRCLLVEEGDRKILIDTGIGNKQSEKFRSHFSPSNIIDFNNDLDYYGFDASEITDVILTHFHFDHAGGVLSLDNKGQIVPTFPNAKVWSNDYHLDWALNPNERERASFLKENIEKYSTEVREQAEINIKYKGYIEKEKANVDKLNRLENIKISEAFDYLKIASLSTEARQKLTKIRPKTLAQAGRISGVSPSDINVLMVYIGK